MIIKPYEKNAKKHPKKQIKQIAESLDEFGVNQPIVVDKEGVIIVGHGRYEAMKFLGWTPEQIEKHVQVADLTEEKAKAYRLADNKLNESDWDMELVIEELKGLTEELIDLTGFSKDLILDTDEKDDEVPEVAEPKAKYGDVFQLGPHRIMCGSSTNAEDVETLMNGQKADMVITDPPYNVDYKGKGTNTKQGIMNDKMSDDEFHTFLVDTFTQLKPSIKTGAGLYIFHSHKTATDFEKALQETGYKIDTQLIWNKPSAGMGANDYRTKHEPFFYCGIEGQDKVFYGDRTGTTVWKIPDDDVKALKWFKKQIELAENGESTIWSVSRANVNEYVHPTQKPVELIMKAIVNSSKGGDIILDLFLGSGTTLIASEKAGRVCYGMELDPKYIDIIIQRYVDWSGNETIIKNNLEELWQMTIKKENNIVE